MKRVILLFLTASFSVVFAAGINSIKKPKTIEEQYKNHVIIGEYGTKIYTEYYQKLISLKKKAKNEKDFIKAVIPLTNEFNKKFLVLQNALTVNLSGEASIYPDEMTKWIESKKWVDSVLYWVFPQWFSYKTDPDPIDDSFSYIFNLASDNSENSSESAIILKISKDELGFIFIDQKMFDDYNDYSKNNIQVLTRFGTNQAVTDVWTYAKGLVCPYPKDYFLQLIVNEKMVIRCFWEDEEKTYIFNISGLKPLILAHTNDYPDLFDPESFTYDQVKKINEY
jgi:hypothetical protein